MVLRRATTAVVTFSLSWSDLWRLTKPRLSLLVVFSAGFGYLFAHYPSFVRFDGSQFLLFLIASFCVSGCGGGLNHLLEYKTDALMRRTSDRPLPSGRLSISQALVFSLILGLLGFVLMFQVSNLATVLLSLLSLCLYTLVYTPLKRVGSVAVLVGAVPGALPPLLGWLATGTPLQAPIVCLFLVQFVWQFPHFWAIAWLADEDYRKAGFKLLPSSRGRICALTMVLWNLLLIPISVLPYFLGLMERWSATVVLSAGLLFLLPALRLFRYQNKKAAGQLMKASFLYLPLVQFMFLIGHHVG